ncbi:MAG: hypothetical protein ACE5IH_00890 [Thermodesulfobacteriota bacterium]
MITDILDKLALYPSTDKKVKKARDSIEKVRDRTINDTKDMEKNIKDILKAIDAIMEITSVDTQDIRLDMDRRLEYGERSGIWVFRGILPPNIYS